MKIKIIAILLVAAGAILSVNGMRINKVNSTVTFQISNQSDNEIVTFFSTDRTNVLPSYVKVDYNSRDLSVKSQMPERAALYIGTKSGTYLLSRLSNGVKLSLIGGQEIDQAELNNVLLFYGKDGVMRLLPGDEK